MSTSMRQLVVQLQPAAPMPADTVQLYELDLIPADIHIPETFVYRNTQRDPDFMPTERLVDSLRCTLDRFPICYGRLTTSKRPGGLEVRPSLEGVPVYETLLDDQSMEDMDSHWPRSTVPPELDLVNLFSSNGDPLFAVNINRYADNSGVALLVIFHHNLMDMTGFSLFMQHWADCMRGVTPIVCTEDRTRFRGTLSQPHTIRKFAKPAPPLPTKAVVHLHCRKEQLEQLKLDHGVALAVPGQRPPPQQVSSLDMLTALSLRAHLRLDDGPRDIPRKLNIPMNARARFPHLFPANYFGNAMIDIDLMLTVDQVLSNPIVHTATRIRQAICAISEQDLWQQLNERADWSLGPPSLEVLFRHVDELGICMTDWSKCIMYEVDFGWGVPECVRPPSDAISPHNAFIKSPRGGLETYMGVTKDCLDRLRKDPELFNYLDIIEWPSQ